MTQDEVVDSLRAKAKKLGSNAALARELAISPQYLNDILSGNRPPGDSVLTPMGLERVVSYRKRVENGSAR